jgi:Beta-lactamase
MKAGRFSRSGSREYRIVSKAVDSTRPVRHLHFHRKGDKLIYSNGYGVRSKGGQPVDTDTIFQIGSTTKAFLATTIAIAVDRGKLRWDDRVNFWVTRRSTTSRKRSSGRHQNILTTTRCLPNRRIHDHSRRVAPLVGSFVNPSFGKASLKQEGDALVLELKSGAQLKLEPWDGDIFTARLAPSGRFAPVAENRVHRLRFPRRAPALSDLIGAIIGIPRIPCGPLRALDLSDGGGYTQPEHGHKYFGAKFQTQCLITAGVISRPHLPGLC